MLDATERPMLPNNALQATCETHAPERRRYARL
jgi:hypothetical protein